MWNIKALHPVSQVAGQLVHLKTPQLPMHPTVSLSRASTDVASQRYQEKGRFITRLTYGRAQYLLVECTITLSRAPKQYFVNIFQIFSLFMLDFIRDGASWGPKAIIWKEKWKNRVLKSWC